MRQAAGKSCSRHFEIRNNKHVWLGPQPTWTLWLQRFQNSMIWRHFIFFMDGNNGKKHFQNQKCLCPSDRCYDKKGVRKKWIMYVLFVHMKLQQDLKCEMCASLTVGNRISPQSSSWSEIWQTSLLCTLLLCRFRNAYFNRTEAHG